MANKVTEHTSDSSSAVIRAVDILDELCESGEPLGVNTIANRLKLPKVTTFRILNSLIIAGLLSKDDRDLYNLSPKFIIYGNRVKATFSLKNVSEPVLKKLSASLGENVNLGIAYKRYVLTLFNVPAVSYILITNLLPISELYCSSMGKVILSHMEDAKVRQYFSRPLERLTSNTIVDYDSFQMSKRRFLENGVMYDDEEFEYGLDCFAAPVYDANGHLIAAVSVSGPKSRILTKRDLIADELQDSTRKITSILTTAGYTVEELRKAFI